MAHSYFVIFGVMRTGSNLLERSLASYEGLRAEGELFNAHFIGGPKRLDHLGVSIGQRNADPVGFLNTVIASSQDIPGFRLFDGHDARMLDHAARDPRAAKILLRRDPLESFVSLKIAQTTGQWMLAKEQNRRLARIRFDAEEFEAYRKTLYAHYDRVWKLIRAAGCSAVAVDYRDLNDVETLNGLAALIGSPERKTSISAPIERQNPAALSDKIENWEDVEAHFGPMSRPAPPPDPDPEPEPRFGALDEMVVSRAFEAIYAPIPGAGAGEVRRFLIEAGEANGAADSSLVNGLKEKHVERRRRRGAFVFTFVRHPAARLHDVFLRRIARRGGSVFSAVQAVLARDYGAPSPEEMELSDEARAAGFSAFLDFIEDNLAGRTTVRVDPAWTPQSTLLARFAEETPVDFIGRVERLRADSAYLLHRLGAPLSSSLPQHVQDGLAQQAAVWPLEKWLTRERETRLRKVAERDYARLGYDYLS